MNPTTAVQQHRRRTALVAALYLGTFIATLDVSIVNVALPTLQRALSTDIAGLQWVIDAYALCLSALMLSSGPLSDRYGRKRAWLAGMAVFTLGSAICALATSLPVLLAGRVVQGVAGALLIPGALSILTQAFPDPARRAHVIGGWSSFSAVSLIIGPIAGGVLVTVAGWPSIFLINLPLGVLAFALGAWGMDESAHPEHAAFDPAGQALSVIGLGALTFGLIAAGAQGWSAPSAWGALVAAGVALVAFVFVERHVARPVLPLDLFREPVFAVTNGASFVLGFTSYSSLFFLSIFLQQVQAWSPAEAGWRMAPQFLASTVMSTLFGRFAARWGVHALMVVGNGLIGVSMLAMTMFSTDTPYGVVALGFAVLGIGSGLAVPATGAAVMAAAPRERSGAASSAMNALRQTGMAIGIALLGALLSARAAHLLADHLAKLGVTQADALAREAIGRHDVTSHGASHGAGLGDAVAHALAGGFHAAMAIAGMTSLVAAAALVWVRHRALRSRMRGAPVVEP